MAAWSSLYTCVLVVLPEVFIEAASDIADHFNVLDVSNNSWPEFRRRGARMLEGSRGSGDEGGWRDQCELVVLPKYL